MTRILVALAVLGSAARGHAQVKRPEAIEVDRDTTPPGQAELSFDGGAPIGAWAAGVTLGYVERPLELHTLAQSAYPIDRRETAVVGGALALGDRLIVDARLPLEHQVGPRLESFGDSTRLQRFAVGDLAIGARLHVADGGPVAVFVRGVVDLPTGDDHDFAGDAGWSAEGLGIARVQLPHAIVIAGTGGFHIRSKEVQVAENVLVGDELVWGVGATVGIPPLWSWWCKPEQLRAALEFDGVVGDRVDPSHGPSPAEVKAGFIGRVRPSYAIAVRAGTHLNDQVGAPEFRATIDLVYQADPDRTPQAKSPETESSGDDD
ncbi:MAG TPA: hypothetical protein VGL61_18680 [Kofleriaceae bacterium]|jgi:hypothetical protein